MFVQYSGRKIVGLFAKAQPGYAEQELPDDHKDIQAYLDGIELSRKKSDAKQSCLRRKLEELCAEDLSRIDACKTEAEIKKVIG